MFFSFYKMSGSGNDFVIIDDRKSTFPDNDIGLIKKITSRSTGIGSDGLILIQDSRKYDFRMRFFNPDGLEQDMCGNGLRCISKLYYKLNKCQKDLYIETNCGLVISHILNKSVKLEFDYIFKTKLDIRLNTELMLDFCDSGVPHSIFWMDNLNIDNFTQFCKSIRHHNFFDPVGTNVNIVKIDSKNRLLIRTFERGVESETLSCGTGAMAAAVISVEKKLCNFPVKVIPRSNDYFIIDKYDDKITLEGNVSFNFRGIWKDGNWYKSRI